MKILVLGGAGRQGSVIATDLKKKYDVSLADGAPQVKKYEKDFTTYGLNLSWGHQTVGLMKQHDLVVNALPSYLGYNIIRDAIDAGVNCVDLSFMSEDPRTLNAEAERSGVTVLYDCGLAPGLSHLIAGQAIHLGADYLDICVGGVAAEREGDYVITWNPADLLEEYQRCARVIFDGMEKRLPALSGQSEEILFGNKMVAFYTDGLRSLLSKKDRVKYMTERTVRWPGHIEKVGDLLYSGNFAQELRKLYPENNKDLVVLKVHSRWADGRQNTALLRVCGDDKMSAMAKTTALSCSAFVQLVADGVYKKVGVLAPDDVGEDEASYNFILDRLSECGIEFTYRDPFGRMGK